MLLRAYAIGVFPMAESRDDPEIYWIDPELRGVLPLDSFHMPRRLKRTLRQRPFEVRCDTDFEGIIGGCAAPGPGRRDTWINSQILLLNRQLFQMGFAHSVECWQDGRLVGGLYGVALGGAFFGESMFSTRARCQQGGARPSRRPAEARRLPLLDTQFVTAAPAALRRPRDQPAANTASAWRGRSPRRPAFRASSPTPSWRRSCSRAPRRHRPGAPSPRAPGWRRTSSR